MLSHVSLGTDDAARAAAFYDPVLAVLGIGQGKRRGGSVDYSAAMIGFSLEQPVDGEPASVGNGAHVCFIAESHAAVDAFYRTALENGGTDARPACARSTTPTTTAPSCAIPTATRSRRSASWRSRPGSPRFPPLRATSVGGPPQQSNI